MDHQLEFDVHWAPRRRKAAKRKKAKQKRQQAGRYTVEMRSDDPASPGFHDWTLQALRAIAKRPLFDLPRIYQLGGQLSRVRAAASGAAARIETLTEDILRVLLSEVCDFDEIRLNHKGLDTHRVDAPKREIIQSILAKDNLDPRSFPPLEILATAPLLGSDGKIIKRPGYHRRDLVFLAPTIEIPPVPARPTRDDIAQATNLILDHYLADFPFADDASRCHALAVILTPLVRRMIQGPTPLLLALASTPGTGKTLLQSALSQIITGCPAEPTPLRSSDDEMTKTLLSVLLAGPAYVFFDNINVADSGTLAAVLSSPACRFAGRILGASRWVEVPALCCWLASGNNPKVSHELARRTVVIKLNANAERPELRQGFKIKSLLRWGNKHRADLLHAALVMCRAWVAAKCPKGGAVLGSFESWAETIGGIMEVCGLPGFLENKDELATRDDHALRWSALVEDWWRQHQSRLVSIDELYQIIITSSELEIAFSGILGQGREPSQKRLLGLELWRVDGRVFVSWQIKVEAVKKHRGYPFYQLLPLAPAPARTREPGDDDDHEPLPRLARLGAAPESSTAWAWEHQRDDAQSEPPF